MTIKELYNKQMEANNQYREEIEKLRKMTDVYTAAELSKQIQEKERAYKLAAEQVGNELVKALNDFRKEKNYNIVRLENATFLGLLQSIQVFGDSTPRNLLDTAVFELKNEQGTLLAIKELFKKHNIHYEGIENILIDNLLIDASIREAQKYGKNGPAELGNIFMLIRKIENIENFTMPEYSIAEETKHFF